MKKVVVAFILGALLASTSTAVAASQYWRKVATPYVCVGVTSGVECTVRGTGYKVAIYRSKVLGVFFRREPIFGCDPGFDPQDNCYDLR